MSEFSLVNVGGITKPVVTLIEKSSEAVQGALRPWQTRRVGSAETDVQAQRIRDIAQAEADAAITQAEGEIQITDLHRRAFQRSVVEGAVQQYNMEAILGKAIPHLTTYASPEAVENDWYANFYSKCRITSDDEMQNLWARILAGQANNPGAFSRKTVNLVADLDKRDAKLFANLCRFVWVISGRMFPIVFDVQEDIYNRYGIYFSSMGHLESLGIVHFDNLGGFALRNMPQVTTVSYFGVPVNLTLADNDENKINIGKVMFTLAGQELARIIESAGVWDFFDYVYQQWESESLVPPMKPQI